MILILGGTTEGRVAVRVADEAAATYYYSTKGTLQSIECAHGIRLTGAMNAEEMECFCRDHAIKLLIRHTLSLKCYTKRSKKYRNVYRFR